MAPTSFLPRVTLYTVKSLCPLCDEPPHLSAQRRRHPPVLVGLGPPAADEREPQRLPLLHQFRGLAAEGRDPLVGLAGQFVGAEDALGVPPLGVLEHRDPLVLVRQVARKIDLVRGLDVQQGLRVVLDADLRHPQGVDQLVRRELEPGGRDLAVIGAVGPGFHLLGVDLHDGEEPRLLDVEVEGLLVARILVLVLLQPSV